MGAAASERRFSYISVRKNNLQAAYGVLSVTAIFFLDFIQCGVQLLDHGGLHGLTRLLQQGLQRHFCHLALHSFGHLDIFCNVAVAGGSAFQVWGRVTATGAAPGFVNCQWELKFNVLRIQNSLFV